MSNTFCKQTVSDFTIEHAKLKPVSFHMPGHKGRFATFAKYGYSDFAASLINQDITEISGADILSHPSSSILAVMENYSKLYGVNHTELLVNGSSAGIIASILSLVPRGGSLIMDRFSHKSAYSALKLGEINPVYTEPTEDGVREALIKSPEAAAVLITSPDYMGEIVNIRRIANDVHTLGKILIVDQAHGAHLKFFDEAFGTRTSAENLGADIVIESTHKTLFTFTGTGILHICSDRVDNLKIRETLSMLQTTSPSYILMDSLDINEKIMRNHGIEIVKEWKTNIIGFCKSAELIAGVKIICSQGAYDKNYQNELDITKIRISMEELGLCGEELEKELASQNIFVEMSYENEVLIYTGAGNTSEDYKKLYNALKFIAEKQKNTKKEVRENKHLTQKSRECAFYSKNDKNNLHLEFSGVPTEYENVSIRDSESRVLYEPIVPFPPGRPIACPGEIVNKSLILAIMKLMMDGKTVLGINDDGEIKVGTVKEK